MKLIATLASLCCVATVAAQGVFIGYPADGATVSPGEQLTVQVARPDTLTGSVEVALVISIAPCSGPTSDTCLSPYDRLGATLYNGPFDPEFPVYNGTISTPSNGYYGPQQNFTVTVPDLSEGGLVAGNKAVLSVIHFSLVGASPEPLFEIKNVTLTVE